MSLYNCITFVYHCKHRNENILEGGVTHTKENPPKRVKGSNTQGEMAMTDGLIL